MSITQPGERLLTYEQYQHEAADFVVHTMATLDMGPPGPEGKQGVNDPTCRVGAFCYGAQIACRPLVEEYVTGEPNELQNILESTFRLSFHFSAGVPLIQSMYQARIARLLREKYGEQALKEAVERAAFNPASAVPPSNHSQGRNMRRSSSRAPAIWQFYMDILKGEDKLGELRPIDKMKATQIGLLKTFGHEDSYPLGLPYFLLRRECVYLEEGRPKKIDRRKKFRSDIIDYALSGRPIGNPEFNLIFSELGVVLHALRKLSVADLPDFYTITETKSNLSRLEELAAYVEPNSSSTTR